jgi:transcriptional regulator with XRE-family HTH domain
MERALRSRLAQAIRRARHAAGLTQEQLASGSGLKGRAVYRWERADSSPTNRQRRALVLAIQAVNPKAVSALLGFDRESLEVLVALQASRTPTGFLGPLFAR